eukprot:CAMPEP_0205905700 /NCGR_PEP_ID=MMETSP1325-20131115/1503_1 /ASSEMBLY_ACC=CAM_ASM_000708 /TAXON_ID=236786 /ORGANISM="Florenciella sp., Strain RCC1007" /LENGTH=69 /DNA_ID=CAMNT_0053271631 /DNA_START=131 /DNA_END=336 /DNA_ORIENTATION=+
MHAEPRPARPQLCNELRCRRQVETFAFLTVTHAPIASALAFTGRMRIVGREVGAYVRGRCRRCCYVDAT